MMLRTKPAVIVVSTTIFCHGRPHSVVLSLRGGRSNVPLVLIDLHAHYPMHLHGGPHAGLALKRWLEQKVDEELVNIVSEYANYQGPDRTPSVTMERIREGRVDVVLSVLLWPSDEIELGILLGEAGIPPSPGGPDNLFDQLEQVEEDIERRWRDAVVVRRRADLDHALATGRTAMVHCVEGGFALGKDAGEIKKTVAELARRGVAYVTVAHLFWRTMATNAPALPFLTDAQYHARFWQPPNEGLSDLGKVAVAALIENGIVIDVTHMSERSLADTLGLVPEKRPPVKNADERWVPVIASHAAGNLTEDEAYPEYNLNEAAIRSITAAGGVIGLLCCTHYLAPAGQAQPEVREDSLRTLFRHIDKIAAIAPLGFDQIAIGSDLDGFIKPALPGFETIDSLQYLEPALAQQYDAEKASSICGGSAFAMLKSRFPTAG